MATPTDATLPYVFVPFSNIKSAEANANQSELLDAVNTGEPLIPRDLDTAHVPTLRDFLAARRVFSVDDYGGAADRNLGAAANVVSGTDNAQALRDTWAAMVANGGGTVLIPPGPRNFESQVILVIPTASPFTFELSAHGSELYSVGAGFNGLSDANALCAIRFSGGATPHGGYIHGLKFNHRFNSWVAGGIELKSTVHLHIDHTTVELSGTRPGYGAVVMTPDTINGGCFWTDITRLRTRPRSGGEAGVGDYGVKIVGYHNATTVGEGCSFVGVNDGVGFIVDPAAPANQAGFANGCLVTHVKFEGCAQRAVSFTVPVGFTEGYWSTGCVISECRIESTPTFVAIRNLAGALMHNHSTPLKLGKNYCAIGSVTTWLENDAGAMVDTFDEGEHYGASAGSQKLSSTFIGLYAEGVGPAGQVRIGDLSGNAAYNKGHLVVGSMDVYPDTYTGRARVAPRADGDVAANETGRLLTTEDDIAWNTSPLTLLAGWSVLSAPPKRVLLPSRTGSSIRTPDTVANSPTGDFTLRARIAPDSYSTDQTLFFKGASVEGYYSFDAVIRSSIAGTITLRRWVNGLSKNIIYINSTANLAALPSGTQRDIKIEFDADNGASGSDTRFYTSPGPVSNAGTIAVAAGAATFSMPQAGVIAVGSDVTYGGYDYPVLTFDGTTGATLGGGAPNTAAIAYTSLAWTQLGATVTQGTVAGIGTVTVAAGGAATFSTTQISKLAEGMSIRIAGVNYVVASFDGTFTAVLTGAPVTAASAFSVVMGVATIFDSTGSFYVGSNDQSVNGLQGIQYRADLWSGIGTARVLKASFNPDLDGVDGATSVTSSLTTEIWTIATAAVRAVTARVIKSNGEVQVLGDLTGGTFVANTVVANLPAGYRPTVARRFLCATDDVTGKCATVSVDTNGDIRIMYAPNNTSLSLNNIVFNTGF